MLPRRWFALLALLALSPAGRSDNPVHFSRDVLPILSEHCFQCHGPDERARKAKLRLDTSEGARRVMTPGKPDDSELVRRIHSTDKDEAMPPRRTNRTLTPAQKETLRRWIAQGAQWGKHWAYETPVRSPLPAVKQPAWPRNAIDFFVLARLEQERLSPSPEAAKETLIRRVTLDLTGLPPTPAEVDEFLADQSPNAYERVVDRLLGSPRYGERMALEWLDEARYADTNGYQNDFNRSMWLWRDWVVSAFNRNLSFDQFVIEQLAGDLLPNPTTEQLIASGFNRNNRTVTEAGSIDEEWRVENNVDRVETAAAVFLGLTMGCARCHDHKFDPITQKEFYQFFAFFNNLAEAGVYVEKRGNAPPALTFPTPEHEKKLQEFTAQIAEVDKKLRKKDLPEAEKKKLQDEVNKLRQDQAAYSQRIPSVMISMDLPRPRETFVLQRGRYELPDKKEKLSPAVPGSLPPLHADDRRQKQERVGQAGSLFVPPTALQPVLTLAFYPRAQSPDRLDVARWLVSPENPLTARVTVNRFWQRYFGLGLVKTPENFGVQSEPPSHPALLDWLATELMRVGWDVKMMQRLIVTSATYRQSAASAEPRTPNGKLSSAPHSALRAPRSEDPDNRLLARGPRFRLPAEGVRDNALAISGLLVERLGGPSVKPYQPAGLWEELAGGAGEGPYVQDRGPDLYRRSLYVYRKRTVPHPVLSTFDAPSREVCQVKRARTNTPLQALALMNDVTYVEAARNLAQRMLTEAGPKDEERLTYAFRRATARRPSKEELHVLLNGLQHYRQKYHLDPDAAQKLIHQGESPVDEKLDVAELAAYTAVAGVILNLDETVTKE